MTIRIEADLNVIPFDRPRFNRGKVFNSKRYTDFKNSLGLIAKKEMQGRDPIQGAFKLSAEFYKKSAQDVLNKNFGDLDNFLKTLLDSLNGICFVDDAQCVEFGRIRKFKSDCPKIIIEIEEV